MRDYYESEKSYVPIYTICEGCVSFIISTKQYLAPTEEKILYEPMVFEDDNIKVSNIDLSFGHPLYTSLIDILHIESQAEEPVYFPVVPDGCMAFVFRGKKDSDETIQAFLCGTIDTIKKIAIEPDEYVVIMRFTPGTGYSLIRDAKLASSITNHYVAIKNGIMGEEQIMSVLERDVPFSEKIGLISKIIRVNIHNEPDRYIIRYCTDRIFKSRGNVRVEELAHETGYTARHIGNIFERCIGLSPKLYSQIIKLQLSMKKILENRDKKLVELALDSGFFDHAHMNRMYKKFIVISSGNFRRNLFLKFDYTMIEDYISEN